MDFKQVKDKVVPVLAAGKDKAANIGCEAAKAVVFPFAWTRMQMGLLPQRISTKIAEVKAAREVAECMDAALTVAAEDLKAVADKADHALDVTEEFIVQKIFKRQEKDIDSLLDSAWDMLMAKLKEKKDGKAT